MFKKIVMALMVLSTMLSVQAIETRRSIEAKKIATKKLKKAVLGNAKNNRCIAAAEALQAGANANAVLGDFDQTLLHHACAQAHVNMVKILIDGGADVNARDNDGTTPLMEVLLPDYDPIIAEETEFGITQDEAEKRLAIAQCLLDAGADLSAFNKQDAVNKQDCDVMYYFKEAYKNWGFRELIEEFLHNNNLDFQAGALQHNSAHPYENLARIHDHN